MLNQLYATFSLQIVHHVTETAYENYFSKCLFRLLTRPLKVQFTITATGRLFILEQLKNKNKKKHVNIITIPPQFCADSAPYVAQCFVISLKANFLGAIHILTRGSKTSMVCMRLANKPDVHHWTLYIKNIFSERGIVISLVHIVISTMSLPDVIA